MLGRGYRPGDAKGVFWRASAFRTARRGAVRTLCVAAAQAVSTRAAVDANVDHHCRLAERATEMGAQVVVFPELSLTGYELDVAESLAFCEADERLAPLCDIAAERAVTLIVGAPIRLGSGLHIGAFVLEPDRSSKIYTKRHLYRPEKAAFVPGSRDPQIELAGDRGSLAICADTSYPEHAEEAAKRGASLYLVGAFFDPEGYPAGSDRLAGYAMRHGMAVVLANAGGPATGFAAAGGSAVWTESGALVAELDGVGSGLVVATRSEGRWNAETARL
jgi:predicted amidohydrolase